jgi:hypothetical protein
MTKKTRHYKTVRSSLMHNQGALIRFENVIYKGFGWLAQSQTILTKHYDDPCRIVINNGVWNLEVK